MQLDPFRHSARTTAHVVASLALLSSLNATAQTAPPPAAPAPIATAQTVLPALFSDGMVLQRDLPVPFWGTDAPGQKVTVTLDKQSVTTTADATGKWLLRLGPIAAGGPYEVTVTGRDTITYKDVLIGDVWLASGQSNMEFGLAGAQNGAEEVKNSADPLLRVFRVAHNADFDVPQTQLKGSWQASAPAASYNFPAAAYFFARELRRELNIPIGIINSSWSGTIGQAWTRREAMTADPDLNLGLLQWQQYAKGFPAVQAKFEADLKAWQDAADKAKADGQPEPLAKPRAPGSLTTPNRPAALYNGMIAPLIPYGIKGALWYQGEGNAGQPEIYKKLLPSMIGGWRGDWGEGDFPFLIVQLPNYMKLQEQPSEGGWAGLREAQQNAVLTLPNTDMAVTIDIGGATELHPRNKQEVGRRLALVAEARFYGRKIPYSGPRYEGMKMDGATVTLRFTHTEGGLKPREGEELKGFAIARADKKFVWATAKIVGETIVLSSPEVAAPAAVRYDWANNPIGNLYNGAGLPAAPFRTDDW